MRARIMPRAIGRCSVRIFPHTWKSGCSTVQQLKGVLDQLPDDAEVTVGTYQGIHLDIMVDDVVAGKVLRYLEDHGVEVR